MSATGAGLAATLYRLGDAWVRTRVLRRRVPLLVGFNITFRCNLRCAYCASPTLEVPEMDTDQVLRTVDDFYALGMRWITFSGGEPLLRKDLGTIIGHVKDKGIVTFISTNGWLIPKRIGELLRADRFTISLDGGERVHDAVRGKNAFAKALAGADAAREHGVPLAFTCVLSSYNLDAVDDVLELAARFGATCMFQPATKWLDSSSRPNPIAPPTDRYRDAIRYLLRRKREGAPITNSSAGLWYLMHWPDPAPIASTAGRITCTIEPDGKVTASHVTQGNCLEEPAGGLSARENYLNLSIPEVVDQSWCAPILELDLLFALNPAAIWNAMKVQR